MAGWFCKLDGSFQPYDQGVSASIESAYTKGERSTTVKLNGSIYVVDFQQMKQTRQDDHQKQRDIARSCWSCHLDGSFQPYDPDVSRAIESAYHKDQASTSVTMSGVAYSIDLKRMKQIRQDDHRRQRDIARAGGFQKQWLASQPPSRQPPGLDTKHQGDKVLYHLTNEKSARGIMDNGFRVSKADPARNYRPWFGEFIYFAGSPKDCEGKAQGTASLATGALLRATVSLGTSLLLSDKQPGAAVQQCLGISSWKDLTEKSLDQAACQSVYVTQPAVSRDEWAVPRARQVRNLRLVGYSDQAQRGGAASAGLPFWMWPKWVHELAAATGVDEVEVDRVAQAQLQDSGSSAPSGTQFGVRVNSAGRPIHENGRFMSYAEATSRGWGGLPKASTPPTTTGPAAPQGRHQGSDGGRRPADSKGPAAPSQARRSQSQGRPSHGPSGAQKPRAPRQPGSSSSSNFTPPSRATNPWNAFTQKHAGQGLSRSDMSALHARSKSVPGVGPRSSGTRAANPWNVFTHQHAGQGLSRGDMSALYHSTRSAPSTGHLSPGPSSGSSGGLGWNAFQHSVQGQGFSKAEISSMYWDQK